MTPLAWAALLVGVPMVGFVAYKVAAGSTPAPAAPTVTPAALPAPAPAAAPLPSGPILDASGQTACQAMVARLVAAGNLTAARTVAAVCPGAVVPS